MPYSISCGGAQLSVDGVCVTVTATLGEKLAEKSLSPGNIAVSRCIPLGSVCGAVASTACADAELVNSTTEQIVAYTSGCVARPATSGRPSPLKSPTAGMT